MDKITGREKVFYIDQCKERECRLSEEIDMEYEQQLIGEAEAEEALNSFIDPPEYQEMLTPTQKRKPSNINLASPTSSTPNHERTNTNTHSPVQTFSSNTQFQHCNKFNKNATPTRPEIRSTRNFYTPIKDAIATVSYRAAVSIPKARVAVQATCEKLYKHKYYLSAEEQQKSEPLAVIEEVDESINLGDDSVKDTDIEPECKKIRSKDEYAKHYKYVLPSRRVVSDYKHKKALQQEIAAANALCDKKN